LTVTGQQRWQRYAGHPMLKLPSDLNAIAAHKKKGGL
jgi:hypothetical protein